MILGLRSQNGRNRILLSIKKSHQTFRSTGGFGLACQHSSLQLLYPILCTVLEEGFSPPPTSSPGLKTVVPNVPVATNIQLFRHSGHHRFFIIFSTRFYVDFGSILDPTWNQNRSKIGPKTDFFEFRNYIRRFSGFCYTSYAFY